MCKQQNIDTQRGHSTELNQSSVKELNGFIRGALYMAERLTNPHPDRPFRHLPQDFIVRKSNNEDFEVSEVRLQITGTEPMSAFLYADIITKGHELTPVGLHLPLPSCKESHYIDKYAADLPDFVLPILLEFFQGIANGLQFGDVITL